MDFKLIVEPTADSDISKAIEYYDAQRKGLGKLFFEELIEKIHQIRTYPNSISIRYSHIRVATLYKFPYLIFYIVVDHVIVVLAVLNSSRNPEKWPQTI
jgi:hypothetical protein